MKRLLVCLIWFTLLPAWAMDIQPCSRPTVFKGAAVNALVLPWRVEGNSPALREAGRQVSSLAHLQLLMGLLKYGSVGAVDLIAEPGQVCDVDQVLAQVSRGGPGSLAPGQAVLVIWGRLFEQDGELFVQTYLRFARMGAAGLVSETFAQPWGGAQFKAGLPMQALACAPRRIQRSELARIDTAFREALRVRPQPDLNLPGVEIGRSPGQSFPYGIAEARGDWMRLVPQRAGLPAGWVRARSRDDSNDWALARWLPELDAADAVGGWLRLQVGGLSAAERERITAEVAAGLARYEAAVPGAASPAVWGLAAALRGHLAWQRGDRAGAAAHFAQARERLPASAAAVNAAAVSALAEPPTAERLAQLNQQLLAALALGPDDALVRANLAAVYGLYAAKPGWGSLSAAELAERRQWLLN